MVKDLKVANEAPYLEIPDMGVVPYRHNFTAYIFPCKAWVSYLGQDEIAIMVNYISHEEAHIRTLRLKGLIATASLDNFNYPCQPDGKIDQDKVREMEIAENTGLELLIKAVEEYSKRNKSVTNVYKGIRRG